MTEPMQFVPELKRPPGHGTLRDQLNDALRLLAQEQQERAQIEADAERLAEFIASRVGARVWAHDDVMRLVAGLVNALLDSAVASMADAKGRGIPPTYTAIAAMLTRRASDLRAEIAEALSSGELDPQRLASDAMRGQLMAQLPDAASIAGRAGS